MNKLRIKITPGESLLRLQLTTSLKARPPARWVSKIPVPPVPGEFQVKRRSGVRIEN
jgi:hypothetical protein